LYETITTETSGTGIPSQDPAPLPEPPQTRRRILFLLPFAPRLDARHGGRTTAGVVARLAERHEAGVLCLRAPDEEPVDAVIRERCTFVEEVAAPPAASGPRAARVLFGLAGGRPIQVTDSASGDFTRRVRALAGEWPADVIHLELERMAQHLGAPAGEEAVRVLVATEAAGSAADEIARAARGPRRLVRALDARAWRLYEREALRRVDGVVCYTDRDRGKLAALAPGLPMETIPLVTELPQRALDPAGASPPEVLFVGGFGHPPNVDAAVRLARSVFPAVLERCPEARLYLVGDKPPPAVTRLAGARVVVTGRVDEVEPFLARAAVVVAPLRLGGGTRVKVLEALAAGKAVVASQRAADGIEVVDGEHLVVAESDDELAEATARLLADERARTRLGARAREWATAELDWNRTVRAYEAFYSRLIGERRASGAPRA
jgi:glycosyltransferase involved in cell wall biosynthesis